MIDQATMAAHDKITWQLYIDANHAGAKRMAAYQSVARAEKHLTSKVAYERGNAERSIESLRERLDKASATEQAAAGTLAEHEKAYTGWSRFWAVPGGHIHSSTHCSTCNNGNRPTEFYLAHEVSGLGEAAAVAAQGPVLCTVCFPSAPVEYTNGHELAAAAKKATQCGGTYDYEEVRNRAYRRYQRCTTCNTMQSITANGNMRAHKKPKTAS